LSGADVCVIDMERHAETLLNHFKDGGREVGLVLVGSDGEAERCPCTESLRGLVGGRVVAGCRARGVYRRPGTLRNPAGHDFKGTACADDQGGRTAIWPNSCGWTIYVLIEAEELGLTSRNIGHPGAGLVAGATLPGIQGNSGCRIRHGSSARAVIFRQSATMAEVFERNTGCTGARSNSGGGLNRLWTQGGLMYAPPLDR
jgi:hypothetical protein